MTKSYEKKHEKLIKEESDLKEKLDNEVTKVKEKLENFLSESNRIIIKRIRTIYKKNSRFERINWKRN